ncbi:hypothetical protein BLNAU_15160 [Blattamonas nauphoetae]|uniref:Mediator of RNA polymerase II transcription subunit 5 n=1 Tax=Blattamonas nauphoetae TaxID=2049346 RepID=A0ABQ9XI23_9EUKA|nr:hypothetical protein BLNAU_15160 [Blattamonas nauphoetae]
MPRSYDPFSEWFVTLSIHIILTFISSSPPSTAANPDLIDPFIDSGALSYIDIAIYPYRSRIFRLANTLMQSSSPLVTHFIETFADKKLSLENSISAESFIHHENSIFSIAEKHSDIFQLMVENYTFPFMNRSLDLISRIVIVVSDHPSHPRSLDFGKATNNLTTLLKVFSKLKIKNPVAEAKLLQPVCHHITLLLLCAASIDDEMSSAAVSAFAKQTSLTEPQIRSLLFSTPPTIALRDDWPLPKAPKDDTDTPSGSVCEDVGRSVLRHCKRHEMSRIMVDFDPVLSIPCAGCLVNAIHASTQLPHDFTLFSSKLTTLSQHPNVWNTDSHSSPLAGLVFLAEQIVGNLLPKPFQRQELSDKELIQMETNLIHLFPFLSTDSKVTVLISFASGNHALNGTPAQHKKQSVRTLFKLALSDSYRTPIALLKAVSTLFHTQILTSFGPSQHAPFGMPAPLGIPGPFGAPPPFGGMIAQFGMPATFGNAPKPANPFEQDVLEKLASAEGDEKWKLLTELIVVSTETVIDVSSIVLEAENDEQVLLALSAPSINKWSNQQVILAENPKFFGKLMEMGGRMDNLPLATAAWRSLLPTLSNQDAQQDTEQQNDEHNKRVDQLLLKVLQSLCALRRAGVEEGCVVGEDKTTSELLQLCLTAVKGKVRKDSFDHTPFMSCLVTLALTSDLSALQLVLHILLEVVEKTCNTQTPFSLSNTTLPFKSVIDQTVQPQSLSTIVSSILLTSNLELIQNPTRLDFYQPPTSMAHFARFGPARVRPLEVLRCVDNTTMAEMATTTVEMVCTLLDRTQHSPNQLRVPSVAIGITSDQMSRPTTAPQLLVTLHAFIMPSGYQSLPLTTLVSLAPSLTRLLRLTVPATPETPDTPDTPNLHPAKNKFEHVLAVYVSLVLALASSRELITISSSPLAPLLSSLCIALARFDKAILLDIPETPRNFFVGHTQTALRSQPKLVHILRTLLEEGIEDRCEDVQDNTTITFLNKHCGSNVSRMVNGEGGTSFGLFGFFCDYS